MHQINKRASAANDWVFWCIATRNKNRSSNLFILFNYILVTSITYPPRSRNVLFGKRTRSILFIQNETKKQPKFKKKKERTAHLWNRPCRQILIVCLMKTKVKRIKLDFPRKTNVYTNSWCNNILLTRLVLGNHQNEKKKIWDGRKLVSQVAHKTH